VEIPQSGEGVRKNGNPGLHCLTGITAFPRQLVNLEFRDLEISNHRCNVRFCRLASHSLKLASLVSSVSCEPPGNETEEATGN
jgi:hypothetical protein